MRRRILWPVLILTLLLSSPFAFMPAQAQTDPLDYLPDSLFLAQADCFRIDGEGTLDFAALLARFAQVPDAATTLSAFGWQAGAYRQFGCDTPPSGSAGYIDISVHLFATADGARQAAPFFAESRILGTDLRLVPGRTAVTGPAGNGTEFTQYLTYGSVLFRITGVAPVGSAEADVLQVGTTLLAGAAIVTGREAQEPTSDSPVQREPSATIDYDVIDLGTGNGNASVAWFVNEQNFVLWQWRETEFPDSIAPPMTDFGLLLSRPDGTADLSAVGIDFPNGLNNIGTVLGRSFVEGAGFDHFLYVSSTGQVQALSQADHFFVDINDSGTLLGTAAVLGPGSIEYVSVPVGFTRVEASRLNNVNEVVGTAFGANPYVDQRAVVMVAGKSTVLGAAPGAGGSSGVDINDSGLLVGQPERAGVHQLLQYGHGFVYNLDTGSTTDIGTLGTYPNSAPTAINEAGQVVGYFWGGETGVNEPEPFNAAFLYDYTTGTMTDLNSLIDPTSGWVLYRAYDINDAGVIVGQGMYNGGMRAFMLVPR